ncbi:MAG TPA: DUF5667 domain-containing protein [Ktedonobacteraceae bacterium]
MKRQQQQRVDQLEELLSSRSSCSEMRSANSDGVDNEVREMAMLARYLQTAPDLQPLPAFALGLERKVLAQSIRRRQAKEAQGRWHWLFGKGRVPRMRIAIAVLLFCIFTSTSTLFAMAATVSNPNSPLYRVKDWEQQAQLTLANSPQGRAAIALQIIQDRLNALPSLTSASHATAYQQALVEIKQQMDAVTSIINTLPAGSNRQNLSNKLATTKTDASHTLYDALPKLPFAEQLTTTTMLGQLGLPVPSIQSATAVITTSPASQATITVTGTYLTSTMHLMVNNSVVASGCVLQQNSCTFTLPWHGRSSLKSIAIINTDCTAAQTTSISLTDADNGTSGQTKGTGNNGDNDTSNSNKGSGSNNRHSTNGGQPTVTPTPHK